MKVNMTYDEFDNFIEAEDKLDFRAADYGTYWPSCDDLKRKFKINNKVDIFFLQWLLDTNGEPTTDEEIKSKKLIRKLLYDHLELADG
jgi:hypothetical protein